MEFDFAEYADTTTDQSDGDGSSANLTSTSFSSTREPKFMKREAAHRYIFEHVLATSQMLPIGLVGLQNLHESEYSNGRDSFLWLRYGPHSRSVQNGGVRPAHVRDDNKAAYRDRLPQRTCQL